MVLLVGTQEHPASLPNRLAHARPVVQCSLPTPFNIFFYDRFDPVKKIVLISV